MHPGTMNESPGGCPVLAFGNSITGASSQGAGNRLARLAWKHSILRRMQLLYEYLLLHYSTTFFTTSLVLTALKTILHHDGSFGFACILQTCVRYIGGANAL